MWDDLRAGWRQLRRIPRLTSSVAGLLALGLGVGTAMFCVLTAALLPRLPYVHPERLVEVTEQAPGGRRFGDSSRADIEDWRARSRTLSEIAYVKTARAVLETGREADATIRVVSSGNLFDTLGVRAALGRTLTATDQQQQAHVLVLGAPLWRTAFGSDPHVVGREVTLDQEPYTVVGVMPAGFGFPFGLATLWTPYVSPKMEMRGEGGLQVVARLGTGANLARAQAEMSGIQAVIAGERAADHAPGRVWVRRYRDTLSAKVRPALAVLGAAVGMLWLIGCAAAAGLTLSGLARRRRELAVRAALGAGRGRLLRQLGCESLLTGLLAAGLAAGVAEAGLKLTAAFAARHLRAPVQWSPMVWAGLCGLTLLSVLVAGVLPAMLCTGPAANEGLGVGHSSAGSRGESRWRDGLVVAQIALAMVLLIGGGVLLRTLYALRTVPLGFTPDGILTAAIGIPPGRFRTRSIRLGLDEPLLAQLQAMPGVRAAALVTTIPLDQSFVIHMHFYSGGMGKGEDGKDGASATVFHASPGFPAVFGVPVLRGRFFTAGLDTPGTRPVVVINEAYARAYYRGRDPVGQNLIGQKGPVIVGVIGDLRTEALATPPGPAVYYSTTQMDPGAPQYSLGAMSVQVAVRTAGPPEAFTAGLREALHEVAPDMPLTQVRTMRDVVDASVGNQVFGARLLMLFGGCGLLIAVAGLYGLLALSVEQRVREIGVRLVLGAERRHILALVMGKAAKLLAAGIALGLGIALAGGRVLAGYVYGVGPRDPLAIGGGVLLLAGSGLWAAYAPARRAGGIAPAEALRAE